jgi:hypothetical protein
VYQGQKVHLFRPSLGFLAEAQPRLKKNRRGQKAHICYQLPNKTRNLLFAICTINYLHIYIIYGDRAIIGFVDFVANRPTERHTQRLKKSYFSSACEYVKLPSSLKMPKGIFFPKFVKFQKYRHNSIHQRHIFLFK